MGDDDRKRVILQFWEMAETWRGTWGKAVWIQHGPSRDMSSLAVLINSFIPTKGPEPN